MNIYIKLIYISIFLLYNSGIHSQTRLKNASFEGQHGDASMPFGWYGESEGTTPDILPGYWGVYIEPLDGESYVGLITREDGTYESIGQRLPLPLNKKTCYQMSVDLARSEDYSGYNKAIKLRIWISDKRSERQQLIYESPVIDSEEWHNYKFEFTPDSKKTHIILEAFINDKALSYKGNILIDKLSAIKVCHRA
ncbi:MAG: hypothetical protein HKN67_09180 [Saprospiraceae bacterium]|nr:hypothetical protein [Saprospiraceae bacterium]